MAAGGAGAQILLKWVSESTQAVSDVKRVNKALGDTQTASDRTARRMKAANQVITRATVAWTGAVIAGVAAYGQMAKAAVDDAKAKAVLQNTAEKTTKATRDQIAAMHDYIDEAAKATLFTDDDLRPAMGNLLRATGDVTKSQELLNLTMDVSTSTGKSAETVSAALAKAYAGNTTSLKKLFPAIDDAVLKSGDFVAIMAALAKQVKGASKAAAEADGWTLLMQDLDEFKESLGALSQTEGGKKFIEDLRVSLEKLSVWLENNPDALPKIAKGIVAVSVALAGLWTATKIAGLVTGIMSAVTAFKAMRAASAAAAAGTVASSTRAAAAGRGIGLAIKTGMAGALLSVGLMKGKVTALSGAFGRFALKAAKSPMLWVAQGTWELAMLTDRIRKTDSAYGRLIAGLSKFNPAMIFIDMGRSIASLLNQLPVLGGLFGKVTNGLIAGWYRVSDALGVTDGAYDAFRTKVATERMRLEVDANPALRAIRDGTDAANAYHRMRPKPKLDADAAPAKAKAHEAQRTIDGVRQSRPVRIDADTSPLRQAVQNMLDWINSTSATIDILGGGGKSYGAGREARLVSGRTPVAAGPVTIRIDGFGGDPDLLARRVASALAGRDRRTGRASWVR